jgi:hypothetical protein
MTYEWLRFVLTFFNVSVNKHSPPLLVADQQFFYPFQQALVTAKNVYLAICSPQFTTSSKLLL